MPDWRRFSRRDFLRVGATTAAVASSAGALAVLVPEHGQAASGPHTQHDHKQRVRASHQKHDEQSHSMTVGEVGPNAIGIDPTAYLTTFDYGEVSTLPSGQTLRDYTIVAADREIEIAPGVFFPA